MTHNDAPDGFEDQTVMFPYQGTFDVGRLTPAGSGLGHGTNTLSCTTSVFSMVSARSLTRRMSRIERATAGSQLDATHDSTA
jgi:hypothetical protein